MPRKRRDNPSFSGSLRLIHRASGPVWYAAVGVPHQEQRRIGPAWMVEKSKRTPAQAEARVLNYYETEALIESGFFEQTDSHSRNAEFAPPTEPAFSNSPLASPGLADILETGASSGYDDSRSAAVHAAVVAAYRQGWVRRELLHVIQRAPRLGERLSEEEYPEVYMEMSWPRAEANEEARECRAARLAIRALRDTADRTYWAGHSGPAAR